MNSEKFDLLMHLTKTTNSAFARFISFDVSYISKIRSGKRKFPKDPAFLANAAVFFADQIQSGKLENIASSMINDGHDWPEDTDKASRLILNWFGSDGERLSDLIRDYLETRDSEYKEAVAPGAAETAVPIPQEEKVRIYYGNKGKRDALLHAFDILSRDPKPYKLFVYSDEPLSWFSEDKGFFEKWFRNVSALVAAGSTITMINYLNRDHEEMKEGLRMWIPLILTGNVRAYCYNKIKENFYDRTLCIAEGKLALTCNSLSLNDYHAVNTLYLEKEAVDALSAEFRRYLGLCRPLFYTYSGDNGPEFSKKITELNAFEDDLYCVGYVPALTAFRKKISGAVLRRSGCPEPFSDVKSVSDSILTLLEKGYTVSEILTLPGPEQLLAGKVPVPMKLLFDTDHCFYDPEEYIGYLEQMLQLSDIFPKYRFIVTSANRLPEDAFLMLKPSGSGFFGSNTPEETIFYFFEPAVVSSLYRVLSGFVTIANLRMVNRFLIRNYISNVRQLLDKQQKKEPADN